MMCQALKELLKEEIQEEIDKATAVTREELANSRAESAKRAMDMDTLRAQLRAAGIEPAV